MPDLYVNSSVRTHWADTGVCATMASVLAETRVDVMVSSLAIENNL